MPCCYIATIATCQAQGYPIPSLKSKRGVHLVCSADDCPFTKDKKVHDECFDELTKILIKHMKTTGSSRSWPEWQLHDNCWSEKGLAITQKFIKCPCTKGVQSLDDTYVYRKGRVVLAESVRGPHKKKRSRVKNSHRELPPVRVPIRAPAEPHLIDRNPIHQYEPPVPVRAPRPPEERLLVDRNPPYQYQAPQQLPVHHNVSDRSTNSANAEFSSDSDGYSSDEFHSQYEYYMPPYRTNAPAVFASPKQSASDVTRASDGGRDDHFRASALPAKQINRITEVVTDLGTDFHRRQQASDSAPPVVPSKKIPSNVNTKQTVTDLGTEFHRRQQAFDSAPPVVPSKEIPSNVNTKQKKECTII